MKPLIKLTKAEMKQRQKEDRELRVLERELQAQSGVKKKTRKEKGRFNFPTFVCVHCKREMHEAMYNSFHKDNCAQNPDK